MTSYKFFEYVRRSAGVRGPPHAVEAGFVPQKRQGKEASLSSLYCNALFRGLFVEGKILLLRLLLDRVGQGITHARRRGNLRTLLFSDVGGS